MFFERMDVKQPWHGVFFCKEFGFKSGTNKNAPNFFTTIDKRNDEHMKYVNESISMGFIEKFVEMFSLK